MDRQNNKKELDEITTQYLEYHGEYNKKQKELQEREDKVKKAEETSSDKELYLNEWEKSLIGKVK